jgi:long-chain acyl-CoA synthetase
MQDFSRLFDIPYYQLEKYPQKVCLAGKEGSAVSKTWRRYSTKDVIDITNRLSVGLMRAGIKKDDKVALIANNRPEWNFIDLAIQQIGAINVPIYPTITERDYAFIFNDAQVKLCFVSDEGLLYKVRNIKPEVATLGDIYIIDDMEDTLHWSELLAKDISTAEQQELEALKAAVLPDDLATLIYTSGTTGNPKGVMLTHNNIISNIHAIRQTISFEPGKRALSFLPLCHSFERMVCYTYLALGMNIWYAESIETLGDNLKEVKPNYFTTVPRLLEKVYEKIMAKGYELTGFKKTLFFWALEVGSQYKINANQGPVYNAKLAIARKLIFSKWKEALGGEVEAIITGAAALNAKLGTLFTAAGIPILEGYGLTETSPVIAANRLEETDRMMGTVGIPIPGVEVKIAEDGEILAKGPNIMKGYYNRPDLTAEVIDADGWFHTGDIGEFVHGRFLKITDRKKELFKTAGGKYIAPQPIENRFKESPMVEQVMVVGGDAMKYVSALMVPSFLSLEDWAGREGITYQNKEDLILHPKVIAEFQEITDNVNKDLSKYETIKKFTLLPMEWGIDTGEMTPTMKLKRKVITEKFGAQIAQMYKE